MKVSHVKKPDLPKEVEISLKHVLASLKSAKAMIHLVFSYYLCFMYNLQLIKFLTHL